jgi:hypothetical protein
MNINRETGEIMQVRPFADTLTALRRGELVDELAEALNELTTACADTGKVGTLTVSIKLKPGSAGQIEVTDEVKLKMPTPNKSSTLMFATPEGNLQRDDPRQMSIEGLREAPKPSDKVKQVAHG